MSSPEEEENSLAFQIQIKILVAQPGLTKTHNKKHLRVNTRYFVEKYHNINDTLKKYSSQLLIQVAIAVILCCE